MASSSAFLPWIVQPQATRPFAPAVVRPTPSMSPVDPVKLPALLDRDAPAVAAGQHHRLPSTPVEHPAADGSASYRNVRDMHLYGDDDASSIALRPIIQQPSSSSSSSSPESQSLPSIQDLHIIDDFYGCQPVHSSSPPLSCASSSSRSNSLSSWSPRSFDSSSRKGSLASLLNSNSNASDSELRLDLPARNELPTLTTTTASSSRRGRPRAAVSADAACVITKRKRASVDIRDDDDEEEDDDQEVAATAGRRSSATATTTAAAAAAAKRSVVTKGLRHFSKLVSDKVAERGVTTYNEVADELAADIRASKKQRHGYDQKNIRRRVYDALNVLMAMDIIAKDKKEIRWLGIPACFHSSNSSDDGGASSDERRQQLEQQIKQEEERQAQLLESRQQMQRAVSDRLDTYLQTCSLVRHNQQQQEAAAAPPPQAQSVVELPFHIVRCNQDYTVDVAHDGRQAVVASSAVGRLAVDSHADVLRSLGYGQMSASQARDLLPDPSWYPLLLPPSAVPAGAS